jgi:hypothetical protein
MIRPWANICCFMWINLLEDSLNRIVIYAYLHWNHLSWYTWSHTQSLWILIDRSLPFLLVVCLSIVCKMIFYIRKGFMKQNSKHSMRKIAHTLFQWSSRPIYFHNGEMNLDYNVIIVNFQFEVMIDDVFSHGQFECILFPNEYALGNGKPKPNLFD